MKSLFLALQGMKAEMGLVGVAFKVIDDPPEHGFEFAMLAKESLRFTEELIRVFD